MTFTDDQAAAASLEIPAPRGARLSAWQRQTLRSVGLAMTSIALGVFVWWLLSTFVFDPFLIPPPQKVMRTFVPMTTSGELVSAVLMSLSRVAVGFISGSFFAVVLGLFMGRIKLVNELVDPMIEFLRFLSPTAMIPIAVIWFGIGEMSKYFLIFWGTIFIVLINTIAGVVRTPQTRQNAALCLGASQMQIFRLIVFPSAIPFIVTGMRVALASAFVSIIPAELLGADNGLGYLLQSASLLLQTDRIFVALVTVSACGFFADRLFRIAVGVVFKPYLKVAA
jgi:NitT/TauT family transport system permease protein/taurine transport system permease protein